MTLEQLRTLLDTNFACAITFRDGSTVQYRRRGLVPKSLGDQIGRCLAQSCVDNQWRQLDPADVVSCEGMQGIDLISGELL